jgi:hypothetical protein
MSLIIFNVLVFSFFLYKSKYLENNISKSLNVSVLFCSIIILLLTEFLSELNLLTVNNIKFCWFSITLLSSIYLFKLYFVNKKNIIPKKNIFDFFKSNLLCSILIVFLLLLIFIQGIIYPPNNYDSMTYHMSRIIHWISNSSVNHYPSHIIRQLYQPPFSEFVIMHFNLLSKNDYYSNSVQFFFLIGIINLFFLIRKHLFLNNSNKLFLIVLLISIPELVLQSSSTQNDIVVSFFIISSIFYLFEIKDNNSLYNSILFSLSIGFAFLTKGTAYIFCLPIIIIYFYFLVFKFNFQLKNLFLKTLVFLVLVFIINLGHYHRNYELSNNILGTSEVESSSYKNISLGPTTIFSNFLKNSGNHLTLFNSNNYIDDIIYKIHDFAKIGINNKNVNYGNLKYSNLGHVLPLHEDYASNTIHFLLIIIGFILFIFLFIKRKQKNDKIFIVLIISISQVILFNFYLKWQPWHTRLELPIFIISIFIVFYVLFNNKKENFFHKGFFFILIVLSILIVIFNDTRPLINKNNISLTEIRFKKYFINNPDLFNEYRKTKIQMNIFDVKNVGLILNGDDFEYPLFYDNYTKNRKLTHIKVNNYSSNIQSKIDTIDCILSTTQNKKYLYYNNLKYRNISIQNNKIWMYIVN